LVLLPQENPEIKKGANVIKGQVTFQRVADAFGLKRTDM
jgi:alanine dehydrogenase